MNSPPNYNLVIMFTAPRNFRGIRLKRCGCVGDISHFKARDGVWGSSAQLLGDLYLLFIVLLANLTGKTETNLGLPVPSRRITGWNFRREFKFYSSCRLKCYYAREKCLLYPRIIHHIFPNCVKNVRIKFVPFLSFSLLELKESHGNYKCNSSGSIVSTSAGSAE